MTYKVSYTPDISSKQKRWETEQARRREIRTIWFQAIHNMPPSPVSEYSTTALAQCLRMSRREVKKHCMQGESLHDKVLWEMLTKLAHPEYGRVFAAIRLTALGVADQYDWGDK